LWFGDKTGYPTLKSPFHLSPKVFSGTSEKNLKEIRIHIEMPVKIELVR